MNQQQLAEHVRAVRRALIALDDAPDLFDDEASDSLARAIHAWDEFEDDAGTSYAGWREVTS